VTHHFLAGGLMVRFFAEIACQSSPKTYLPAAVLSETADEVSMS
jgi:hypothetical protein